MSSLADRIKKATPPPRKLSLNEWLISLSPEDTAAAEDMARDRSWSNVKIVAFLAEEKPPVAASKDTVAVWRKRCGFTR